MTTKFTISLPDDLADYVRSTGNASGYPLPAVEIVECRVEDADMVGKIARKVERLSLAHSRLPVYAIEMPLMTADGGRARKALESGLVRDLN